MDHHHRHQHYQRHHNAFMDSRQLPVRPPPPVGFHADPNLYHRPPLPPVPPPHHHTAYHHQLPPPPPPQQHPSHFQPPPPPHYRPPSQVIHQPLLRPLAPHQPPPSFPYHHHNHSHHHEHNFDFPPSLRVLPANEGLVYDNTHYHHDDDHHRLSLPEPPRFSPTASMAPPISSSGFDRAVDFNHMSPPFREIHSDEFRHKIQSPQRFGDDLEGIRSDDWCNDRRSMDDVESDRVDDHFHDPYHPQMLPRGFDLNPGGSECLQRQMDDEVLMEDSRDGMIIDDDINVRYDIQNSSREVSCSPIKFRNRGISRVDSFSEFYEEDMNRRSESVRYYERGRRQDMQDYNRSTRKNLRKKSAFLRIHPLKHSNFRNKHDTTPPSPHKEPSEGLGDSLREGSDGSLVELDVSFKSNSLVAKAIVPAPSSSQMDPIDNSSLNDLDIRVDSKSPSKAEGNRNCGYNCAVLTKVEKQSENRVRISPTLKRGGLPGKADVRSSNTESASTGSVSGDSAHRGSPKGEISSKDSTNPGPRDISCPKVRKKRKSDIPLSRLPTSPLKTDTAGKKMKFIPFESVLSERSSQNSDLLGPLDSLISKAEFRSTSTECSMQPAEPIEQYDSVVLEKNIVASASNSLQTRFSDPESTNSDLSNGAQCSSASEKAPLDEKSSTYMLFKQEESPELVMGASSGGNHSALQSENRIKTDIICGGTQCMEIGDTGNSSHMDILDEDNVAVNDNQASESKCLHLQVECNDGATSDNHIGIIGDPGHGSLVLVGSGDNIAVNDNLLLSGSNCLQMHGEFTNDGATADDHIGISGHGPLGIDDIGSGDNIAVNDNITPGSTRLQVLAECTTGDEATAGDLFGDSCHGHGLQVVNIGSGDNIALNVNMPSDSNCQQMHAECTNDRASTADHITDSVYGPRVVDVDSGDNIAVNDNLPSGPDLPQLHADDGTATNFVLVGTHSSEDKSEGGSLTQDTAAAPHISLDEKLSEDAKHASKSLVAQGSFPDAFVESNEGKSEGGSLTQDTAPAPHISLDEKLSVDAKHASESLVAQGSLPDAFVESNEANPKPSISAAVVNQPFAQKNVVLANNAKSTSSHVNLMNKQPLRKNVLIRGGGANCSSIRGPSVTAPPSKALSTYHVKPRTWRRTDNLLASNTVVRKASHTAPLQRPPIDKITKAEGTSYIRKGNSLVRNPAARMGPGASSKSNAVTYLSKITRSPNMIESTVVPDRVSAGARNTHVQMPSTPPLPCSGMASDPEIGQSEGIENKAAKSCETAPSSSRNPKTELDRSVEDSGALSDGNFSTSDSKRTVSLKRKSNQLILPANPSKSSMHTMDKAPALSSDNGYYKRRKNQLIRASSEGNLQNMVSKTDDISNAQPQKACDMYSGRNFTKRQSNKGKPPKSSLVWKLGDAKSSGKGADPLRCGKILSHLLPWKRATYWRSVWRSSTQLCGSSSLMITRRLLSPRKRAAIYVRSGRGFSLRRSKVISLAGYSLKWSKSMEKRSKKVDEEVVQAVAKMGSAGKPKAGASGERIFRIGMFRYRMDPSRRTLQRIADEVSSNTATSKLEHGARKTYVPKRLLIGSNEYVRIGNGNQLVRDPKRRTRLLASEKVRWSLHTARMRLAKKRKFCQFFTRFGKCNKGEGKCPFIHDPSKIAVCTKFLNGLCGDVSCKLTHKVIPERMPDCSFFLQGSCSNVNCPYRHVNVNPKAPICENFLRGYCVDGNECLKKHSYICPEFEATGSCPQGSRCKLYHPKKGKGKKKKTLKDHRNSRGRYFGSEVGTNSDPEIDTTEKLVGLKNGGLEEAQQGLGDFISLDVSDNEFGENDDTTIEPMSFSQAQDVNSQLDHIHQLILPLRILG